MSAPTDEPSLRPAGVVTRLLAAAADVVVVLLTMLGLLLGAAGLRFLWSPLSFSWPTPSPLVSTLVGALLATGYLTLAWATTGRSYGAALLGLRVLSVGHGPLGWTRAGLRAALYVLFPIGLLWAAVSKRRRSLQDAVVRSIVVYDWHQGAAPEPPDQIRPSDRSRFP